MPVNKANLTAEEKITVAYFHIVRGVEQQVLAEMFRVNGGRVNEAVQAVRKSVGLGEGGYKANNNDKPKAPIKRRV
jgi:hypothetical protein